MVNKKLKKNSYLTKKKKYRRIKKGGVNSTKKVSLNDRVELKTIKTRSSPTPVFQMFDTLNIDDDYIPSSKCIKLQKELDDYDRNIKSNLLLQANYNEELASYYRNLEKWYNSDDYKELEEGMYYSSLSDEKRRRLEDLEPRKPDEPRLKILKKPTKEFIQSVAKACGKHFVQNI